MPYELERIQAWHRLAFELHVAGKKNVEIAEELNRNPQTVSLVLSSPLAQDEIARLRRKRENQSSEQQALHVSRAKQLLEEATVKAAGVHIGILDAIDIDPSVKQKSASYILDKAFGKDNEKANAQPIHISVDVAGMIQTMLEESRKIDQLMQEKENRFIESVEVESRVVEPGKNENTPETVPAEDALPNAVA